MTEAKMVRLPPGVTVEQRPIAGGIVYTFTHEHTGRIGRIALVANKKRQQTQIAVEVGPCDPDSSGWEACFEQFTPIVQAWLAAYGIPMPLPSREDARHTARLYWRFLQVEPGRELEAFAAGLSLVDYGRLCAACKQALWVALPDEATGLRLRLKELHALRNAEQEERPDPEDGLYLRNGTRFVRRRTVIRRKGSKRKRSSQME
jgi:hypothetical protein